MCGSAAGVWEAYVDNKIEQLAVLRNKNLPGGREGGVLVLDAGSARTRARVARAGANTTKFMCLKIG